MPIQNYDVILCGAGPANISLLPELIRNEQAGRCLILEKNHVVGAGEIGQYRITANSLGGVFLEKFQDQEDRLSRFLKDTPQWRYLHENQDRAVELSQVGAFLEQIAAFVMADKALRQRFVFSTDSCVQAIRQLPEGGYLVSYSLDGVLMQAQCRKVICNLGGQPQQRGPRHASCNINSDEFIKGLHDRQFRTSAPDSVAILGSSHSAVSCLIRLVEQLDYRGPITLLAKRDFKLFFDCAENARAQGYHFTDADVCNASGRINRYSGLRYDSFEFARKVQRGQIDNLQVVDISTRSPEQVDALINSSAVLLNSTGYSARAVELLDADSRPIQLQQDAHGLLTNARLNPMAVDGRALEDFHTFGLGSGIKTGGDSGGEESFSGRIDGVWVYQHVVPGLIFGK
ncbi:hypothetical protein [Pseudomonas piscis]|uniref:hypothetical protein n=1 Tax=Pseudomonas piscis TaxID=2614538 RepID=UPI0003B4542A|nr:hypothetical protein [Pseudomonas piscis]ERO61508.1 hypothetical protein P308_08755 [Pseudomonas piscis]